MYKQTKEDSFKDLIFQFSEKDKSALLNNAILNQAAKKTSILPDNLLKLEKYFKGEISYYESKLKSIDQKKDSVNQQIWNNNLFQFKRKSDSLLIEIEKSYPNYFNAKYIDNFISIEQVKKLLPEKTAILEYVINKDSPLVIMLTKNKSKIIELRNFDSLTYYVNQYRNSLSDWERNNSQNFKNYTSSAKQLYNLLIAPIELHLEKENIKNLSLVTDAGISLLPFESFLTKKPKGNSINFKSLSFLIEKYNINYQYSATLAFNKKDKSNNESELLAFAPSFNELNEQTISQVLIRGNKIPLKWNTTETNNIKENYGGLTFNKSEATESKFKNESNKAKILHLATHAFVDKDNPMNSQIVFSNEQDTIEDGSLHAFEIYGMELDVDMVTLSACNTGYGEYAEGEGTLSLARAFSYAGASSIVMSHWEVDDKITADLMTLFYQKLKTGLPKDQALRQAKLQLMEENGAAISDPYYWAAFVTIGDVSPLNKANEYWWPWILTIFLIIILLFFFYSRKKKAS